MRKPATVLLCDDDPLYAGTLQLSLGSAWRVEACGETFGLLRQLRRARPDALVLDLCFGEVAEGFDLIKEVVALRPGLPVVVHSGLDDFTAIVRAMQLGATSYVPKHSTLDVLARVLEQHVDWAGGPGGSLSPESRMLLGPSAAARHVENVLAHFACSPGHVLIVGEPGTGKRLAARSMSRRGRAWVELDGSSAGEEDIGMAVAAARGGFLFVDSLGDLPMRQQKALWRALDRQQGPPGEPENRLCRVVATARGSLGDLRLAPHLCADLLARLAVLVVPMPPLRERREDIAGLVEHFAGRAGCAPGALASADLLAALTSYPWPGNVRELANAVQYVLAMAGGRAASREHLPPEIARHAGEKVRPRLDLPAVLGSVDGGQQKKDLVLSGGADRLDHASPAQLSFRAQCRDFERSVLKRAYMDCGGHIASMSEKLELNRTYLYEKLRAYRIIGR